MLFTVTTKHRHIRDSFHDIEDVEAASECGAVAWVQGVIDSNRLPWTAISATQANMACTA